MASNVKASGKIVTSVMVKGLKFDLGHQTSNCAEVKTFEGSLGNGNLRYSERGTHLCAFNISFGQTPNTSAVELRWEELFFENKTMKSSTRGIQYIYIYV